MPKPHYTIKKQEGETPLQALARLREQESLPHDTPLAYAGRLDPMASGKLLVLAGDECKRQKNYHALDKEYVFEILFNISSDTGDILGISEMAESLNPPDEASIRNLLVVLPRKLSLPYPAYSSKTVKGKPLFLWALEGRLGEIQIPTAETKLYKITYKGIRSIQGEEMLHDIERRINILPYVTEESKKLGANFRREEILNRWHDILWTHGAETFFIAKYSVIVSSGTYIRALAPHIARKLGSVGLAYSIHRTTMGHYVSLTNTLGFWRKKY